MSRLLNCTYKGAKKEFNKPCHGAGSLVYLFVQNGWTIKEAMRGIHELCMTRLMCGLPYGYGLL
jgi:hypothetical protein